MKKLFRKMIAPAALILFLVLSTGIFIIIEQSLSKTAYSPDNPGKNGMMALARILENRGITVNSKYTPTNVIANAKAGTTVLVVNPSQVSTPLKKALEASKADLVLLGADGTGRSWFSGKLSYPYEEHSDTNQTSDTGTVAPRCTDLDAVASGTLTVEPTAQLITTTLPGAKCYPAGGKNQFRYIKIKEKNRTVTAYIDPKAGLNPHLENGGNAALMIRLLDKNPTLIWYLPSPLDKLKDSTNQVPPWFFPLADLVTLTFIAAAFWRGRRMGRLVSEKLPVVVPAAETALGLGRLYAKGRDRAHSATQLRAGTALRCAKRLGVSRTATKMDLINALSRATGHPEVQIENLFYGPAPKNDKQLVTLARDLESLEKELIK